MNGNLFEIIVYVLGAVSIVITLIEFHFKKPIRPLYRVLLTTAIFVAVLILVLRLKDNATADRDPRKFDLAISDSIKNHSTETPPGTVAKPAASPGAKGNKKDEGLQVDPGSTVIEKSNKDIKKNNTQDELKNYVNASSSRNDIAVLIIDKNGNPINTMASEIASLYRDKGHSVTTSLFTSDFLKSNYLNEVQNANANILDKLELASRVNYIVIAKYTSAIEPGEQTKWISRVSLEVSIVSCITKSLVDAFTLNPANGFDDQQGAEKGAKEKIMLAYKASHLNL